MGRGCPVDWNEKEGRYNWELVFCELYAGGKYDNENSENYEFSLGLNGLGSCATQYASRYMDVTVYREGKEYRLHFERGEIVGKLESTELTTSKKRTGSGGVYRHRRAAGLLSGRDEAAGSGQRRRYVPPAQRDGSRQV